MLWIPVALASYFLSALASTADKILLSERIPNPAAYTFYVGVLSIGVFVLLPFGFFIPEAGIVFLAFASGISFLVALYFLFSSFYHGEVSRAATLAGAASPFFILLLSWVFLSELPEFYEVIAILFFVAGGAFLSFEPSGRGAKINFRFFSGAVLAAFFFALTFFLSKEVFKEVPFITGFILARLGSFLAALLMLLWPSFYRAIFESSAFVTPSSYGLLVSNKVVGAVGFLLLNYSISLGPVSVVNAMKGVEYLFVFLFVYFLTFFYPRLLREEFNKRRMMFKFSGIVLAGIGFIFLVLP